VIAARNHIGFIPKEVAVSLLLAGQARNGSIVKCFSVGGRGVSAEILFSVGPVINLEPG
jgi:hypothetical protein